MALALLYANDEFGRRIMTEVLLSEHSSSLWTLPSPLLARISTVSRPILQQYSQTLLSQLRDCICHKYVEVFVRSYR